MAIHYKIDLLNDEELAAFALKAGDVLTLDVPDAKGKFTRGENTVLDIETEDVGSHPDSGEHLTRVTLKLEA
jgi:hypothetical protein